MVGTGMNLDGHVRQTRQSFKPCLVSGHGLRPIGNNRGNQRSMSRSNTPQVQVAHPVALHLKPFSLFVVAAVDRQIGEIDAGKWQSPLAAAAEHGEPATLPKKQAA